MSPQWRPQHLASLCGSLNCRLCSVTGLQGPALHLFLATSHETGWWPAGLPWNSTQSFQALLEVIPTCQNGLSPSQ